MRFFIDKTVIKKICLQEDFESFSTIFTDPLTLTPHWPSFFFSLNLEGILEDFPLFNQQNSLFRFIQERLDTDLKEQELFDLYDLLFVECLTSIKNLKGLNSPHLLKCVQEKKLSPLFPLLLEIYEKKFLENPAQNLHDLILYLAWDRMCVCAAILFEQTSCSPKKIENLHFFKNCLTESFLHIKKDNKTIPGFFRFIEALYAYDLREEQLDFHSPEEWAVLCAGAPGLKPRHLLSDTSYIDFNLQQDQPLKGTPSKLLTFESPENIQATLQLVQLYLKKISKETQKELYYSPPTSIFYLQEEEKLKIK